MANPNQNNNYFISNIRRWNREDFVCMMKPEQIQRDAKNRIFREMVQGKIDYSVYGKYFLEAKFMDNLIISAENELRNNTTILNALEFYDVYGPIDSNVGVNRVRYHGLCYIYQTLLNRLNMTRMYNDVGYLTDIAAVLVNQRTFI